MEIKTYKKGDVIFRQGDSADSMYNIFWGRIGIYVEYGTPNEKKLATLNTDDFFGEMGMLDHVPRSATAVVLQDETQLQEIREADFEAFLKDRPTKVFVIMQKLCHKLRNRSREYLDACRTVYETVEAEEAGRDRDPDLDRSIARIVSTAQGNDFFYTV